MIPEPRPNEITRPYRGLSVQEVAIPLTPARIEGLLRGRDIYRRTAYLALRGGDGVALVGVRPARTDQLFSPVAEVRVLSGPTTTVWVDEPATDVGNASALAAAARARRQPDALAYVVRGRYEHVNFIWQPAPLTVHVTEVVPPEPPKLLAMAQQAVAFDEDLPPVDLVLDAVDVRRMAADNPAPHHLLPCRGSLIEHGGGFDGAISFLDTHPPYRDDWLLVGCERSQQFHQHFYGARAQQVDLCPAARVRPGDCRRVLTKCCLAERGIRVEDGAATVPWGANLDEVRAALRALCGLAPAAQAAAAPDAAMPTPAAPATTMADGTVEARR